MLKKILGQTQLGEKAFQPKRNDFLNCSDKFWKEEYQKKENSNELEQVFSFLIEVIDKVEIELNLKNQLIRTIEELNYKCQTILFAPYIEGIKEKLKIIAYYLLSPIPIEAQSSIALKLLDTNVCAEGFFLKLQQIVYVLNDKTTIFNWLANLRLELIYRFFYKQEVQSVHNFNAILNYAQKIGLNVIDDSFSTQTYLANDRYLMPLGEQNKNLFINFFTHHYRLEIIIQYITQQLETELKVRINEFQQEISPFGLVISAQNTFYNIEKKLNGLPIKQLYKLLKPISEESDNYYVLKSTAELKQEVARYLTHRHILKAQCQKFELVNGHWNFIIIEGDTLGEYSYISHEVKPFLKELFTFDAFDEKELYRFFSLEELYKNKRFFRLGQNSFNYFLEKEANFSNFTLKKIDFTKLGASFLFLPNLGLYDAFFIQPKLSYKQLICLYKIKKYKQLNNDFSINSFNLKQFFKIITEILEPDLKIHDLFLERHRHVLLTNGLDKKILDALLLKIIDINKIIKNINKKLKFLNYSEYLLSIKLISCAIALTNLFIVLSAMFFPLLYVGLGLIVFDVIASYFSYVFMEKIENKQMIYCDNLNKIRVEERIFINVKNKLEEFNKEQLSQKKDLVIADENCKSITKHSHPTSISSYLLMTTQSANERPIENSVATITSIKL